MSKTFRKSIYHCVRLLSRVIPTLVLFTVTICNGADAGKSSIPRIAVSTLMKRVSNPQNPRRSSYTNQQYRRADGAGSGNDPQNSIQDGNVELMHSKAVHLTEQTVLLLSRRLDMGQEKSRRLFLPNAFIRFYKVFGSARVS